VFLDSLVYQVRIVRRIVVGVDLRFCDREGGAGIHEILHYGLGVGSSLGVSGSVVRGCLTDPHGGDTDGGDWGWIIVLGF